MFIIQLILILFIIFTIYSILEFKKYNKNGIITEYINTNYMINIEKIKKSISLLNPVLINIKNNIKFDDFINNNNNYLIIDKGFKIKKIIETDNISIIRNKDIYNDLLKDKIIIDLKLFFNPYIPIINKNSISILKGYNLLPMHLCKNNHNLLYIIDGNVTIYLFNPKHKNDIENKRLDDIKKYSHKYYLEKDNLLIIPTNWYYIQESNENVIQYHSDSDNIFCILYNLLRK